MPDFHYSERDDQVFPELFIEPTPIPRVGDFVRLAVRNNFSAYMYKTSLYRFMGRVIPLPSTDYPKDAFCVWVEGDMAPVRVVQMRHLHSINGVRVKVKPTLDAPPPAPVYREFQITGSKGDTYTVVNDDKWWTCTCVGFGFRRTCRHVAEAQVLAARPLIARLQHA